MDDARQNRPPHLLPAPRAAAEDEARQRAAVGRARDEAQVELCGARGGDVGAGDGEDVEAEAAAVGDEEV